MGRAKAGAMRAKAFAGRGLANRKQEPGSCLAALGEAEVDSRHLPHVLTKADAADIAVVPSLM